jgi:hypothetical protein
MLHWILTDTRDNTYGQPIAINSAVIRWHHLHKWMAFYDTDEFLVLPHHTNIRHFVAAFAASVEPIVGLRTTCAWGMVNLTGPEAVAANVSVITQVTLAHMATLPVDRGVPGSREKYWVNTSALDAWGVRNVNIHGVYSHQGPGGGGVGQVVILMPEGAFAAYHLHLLNTISDERKNDYREVFMPKRPIRDAAVNDMVRRAVVARVADAKRRRRREREREREPETAERERGRTAGGGGGL